MAAVGDEHAEMEDVSDYELSHYVRKALKSVLEGKTDDYDQFIRNMHHNDRLVPDEVAMLVVIMWNELVELRTRCDGLMDTLMELIVALAASNGRYVDFCLDMLVSNFIPPFNFLEILKQPRGLAKKDQVIIRVHLSLKGIADLVPLAPSRLEQIVRERVPNVFSKEAVEIGWDEILLDDPSSKGIFEMELEDMARPVDETEMDVDEEIQCFIIPQKKYSGRKVLWGNVVAQKLDALMDLTFDHLQSCFKNGRLHQVFKALLQLFQSTVLNAYKSKFAQFESKLLEIFCSTIYPQDWRMSAVAYLASYLSLAKFLSTEDVTIILKR
ncbi:hypothetical protein E3N88_37172 [Mikania micrantha]|uniref:Uncharacterized protein n=1 Tax=Mikania micrantha TaxID=192012 RepID=A0A5N6M6A8_9ASTR|nr:hypothetical protein E3N88_44998 [Mikania micrantha]KAD3069292.1 hypothetical protein E3N88_37172 [Mikania micrantha]